MTRELIFASRPSNLARWQTNYVIEQLHKYWIDLQTDMQIITTRGDQILDQAIPDIGGKGLFTYELEEALLNGRLHAAVHSLKDLPTENSPGLTIASIPIRADYHDVLVCPAGLSLKKLPSNSVIGTSSVRRGAQILAYRPDLQIKPIRGNVETRIKKIIAGEYDAAIMAAAGLTRLGLQEYITENISEEIMLPAAGQGALAVQCRSDDDETINLLQAIHHQETALAVRAERAFLAALGGGCSLPVAALAYVQEQRIELTGVIVAPDGSLSVRNSVSGFDPLDAGRRLAKEAIDSGAWDAVRAMLIKER
jgi:hydroxymethylbilane synthase